MDYEAISKELESHFTLFTDADDCTAEYIYRKGIGCACEIVSSRSAKRTIGKHTLDYTQVTCFKYKSGESGRVYECYVMGAYL